ncbi:hypothetical protein [Mesorhizobium sp. L-8-3]|uniref:hypothetical protein n=1 Tax=Mesorhizobium sp. L-8-3 TaxID=2744522 RepID=UPI0019294942|nr:hypothetical protein [Mesorhizobium sp. L-8-3]BCH27636.1 hypothetical protein MesoLjLb_74210 [Mesorhizobium sp. L-8-3]
MRSRRFRRHAALILLPVAFLFAMTGDAIVPSYAPPPQVAADASSFFVSGHSLTDRPLPDMLEDMARQGGRTLFWQRQHIGGSSIRQRSEGSEPGRPGSGYAAGTDRDGNPIDVLAAFGAGYDVLIITEWHRVLDAMLREGTAGQLRDFQDRFIAANPDGASFFFAPWTDLSDPADPSDWIAYERAASPIWQCLVETVNRSLARGSRADRIGFIPASLALAELVERLTSDGLPGFSGMSTPDIVAALFSDRVHLTELGTYFTAVVTYASVFGEEAATAAPPTTLDPVRAEALRDFAIGFVARWQAQAPAGDCDGVPVGFILAYTGYMERTYSRPEMGYVPAQVKRLRDTARFLWRLRSGGVRSEG